MIALWQIVILAIIQGAAELLPVSSSAHVIVAERLMGLDPSAPELTFLLVMLHTGTMGAAILYFRKPWAERFRTGGREFIVQIVLATAMTGILGLGLKFGIEKLLEVAFGHPQGEIESLFKNLPMIAAALFAVGLFILYAGLKDTKKLATRHELTRTDSTLIGLIQGICLPFRGFSRSGATISTALVRGVKRETAEEFSFALSVVLTPPVIAQQLHRLIKHSGSAESPLHGLSLSDLLLPGMLGMALAFGSGLLALRWLSSWLENGKWQYFGIYCLLASALVGGAAAYGL